MRKLKRILFGSPDRTVATISLIVGMLGLIFALITYSLPIQLPLIILARDFLIVAFLVLYLNILSVKYFRKDDLVDRFRELLKSQVESSHHLIHKFRNHVFGTVRLFILKEEKTTQEYDEVKRDFFVKVCHSVTSDVRKIFQSYFVARGFDIGEDLCVTLKIVVRAEEAQGILNALQKEKADQLSNNQSYIVTGYRDPDSWERKPERKEVKGFVYRINEENTAFNSTINSGEDYFLSNDLGKDASLGKYRNQNPNWHMHYNSTLLVPVRYRHGDDRSATTCYGVLAIDSKNNKKYDLFDSDTTVNMIACAADALALMFFLIETLDIFKKGMATHGNNK